MSEMVDRIADLIFDRSEVEPYQAKEIARVAIEAMREPTEKMLEVLRKQGGIDGYAAMIDAA